MTQEEINAYLEQTDKISRTPYGPGNKRYNAKKEYQRKQQEYADLIRQGNANYNAPAAPIGNRFPNDSVYDEGITVYDLDNGLNTYRDEQQSGWAEAGNILLHGATSAATAFAGTAMLTNPYGLAAMAGATAIKAIENATDDNKENDNLFAWFADNAINKLLYSVNDAIISNTPVYSKSMDEEGLSKYLSTAGLDQLSSGLGYLVGGIGSSRYAASKLSKGSQFYDYILNKAGGDKILKGATLENAAINGIEAVQDIDKLAKAKKLADGITGLTASLVGRVGESVIEAQGTKQEMLDNGYTEEQADQALKYGFASNLALSSIDYFQNLKMFGTFKGILGTEAKAVKYADDIIFAAEHGGLGKYDKATQMLKSFGENFVTEGGEEGLQYAINKGAQDTAIQKEGALGFIQNLGKEFGNSFVTEEGQLSWILGGILGGGAGSIQGAKTAKVRKEELANYISEAKTLKGELDANYKIDENALYSTYRMPDGTIQKVINQKYIDTISNNNELETVKQYAQAKNDDALYESAKNKQILNKALFALHTNTFDSFIGELETSKDITPEELTKLKALQDNTSPEKTVVTDEDLIKHKQGIDKGIRLAKEFKNLYNSALELPQLSNLSKDSMFNLFKLVSSQKATAAQLQEANPLIMGAIEEYVKNPKAETNEALNLVLDSTSDPIEKDKLENEYEKYKDLGLVNKHLLEKYSKLMQNPKKIQDKTNQEEVNNAADLIKDTEEELNKDTNIANEAARKLEDLKQQTKEPITIETEDGDITVVNQDGTLINIETGESVENELLEQFKKNVIDEEEIESEQTPEEYNETQNDFLEGPKKPDTHSTSTRGLDINYTESSSGHYAKDIDNLFQYVLYAPHKLITKWFSSPKNTPSDTKKFTAKLTEEPVTQQLLDDINARRATWAAKNLPFTDFKQLTLEDLQSPKYKPLRMWLYENGKLVKQSEDNAIHFHDVDYFFDTQSYLNILNDENIIDKQAAINLEINKLTAERTKLVANLATAELEVNDKSHGVLNFLPNIKVGEKFIRRILPIGNLANQEGSYGIGYVESIDENGVASINYNGKTIDSGRKDLKLGELVFDIISANGSHLVNNNITKNKYTPEQIDSIAELLIYKITSGTDTIKVNGQPFNIKDLLRSFIFLGINKNNSEATIAFSKEGDTLIVGRDKKINGVYDNSSKWDKKRAIKDRQGLKDSLIRLLSDNYHAYPNPDMKILNQKSNTIVFPTEINELGEAKGDIIPIQDFFLNGKEPMIGTNINPNIPFINSYFSFNINGGGLVFDVKEENEPYASNLEGTVPTAPVSDTVVKVTDLPTKDSPSLRGTIETPESKGHFTARVLPDGTSYIFDIQIGYDENAPRGKGYGLNVYIQIGKKLKELGYTLESTQWDKHTSAISPQALRVWEKLVEKGYAKITGQKQNKVYNRETGEEEVKTTNVYEFTELDALEQTNQLTPTKEELKKQNEPIQSKEKIEESSIEKSVKIGNLQITQKINSKGNLEREIKNLDNEKSLLQIILPTGESQIFSIPNINEAIDNQSQAVKDVIGDVNISKELAALEGPSTSDKKTNPVNWKKGDEIIITVSGRRVSEYKTKIIDINTDGTSFSIQYKDASGNIKTIDNIDETGVFEEPFDTDNGIFRSVELATLESKKITPEENIVNEQLNRNEINCRNSHTQENKIETKAEGIKLPLNPEI